MVKTFQIIKNTYPRHAGVARGELHDEVEWKLDRGCYRLIRISDKKEILTTPEVDKDGLKISNGRPPVLHGVIAHNKSMNWKLEIK